MSININLLYEHILGNRKSHKNSELTKELKKIKEDPKLSLFFRKLLREQKSVTLETELYGNITDDIFISEKTFKKYQFPSDEEILKKFYFLNQEHPWWKEHNNDAKQEFIKFFKICKIMGDFIEKNNPDSNEVAYNHAYKAFVLFFNPREKGKVFQPLNDFSNFLKKHNASSRAPIHDTFSGLTLPKKNFDINSWKKLLKDNGRIILEYLSNAPEIEKKISRRKGKHGTNRG